ncbi:kinase-like protein, partial [Auricularia subglabra TFB-10046 SS5]
LLRRELYAVRHVRHRHILHFVGTAQFDLRMVIASPFMENGNLLTYVKQHCAADRKMLILQVAEAVDHLHNKEGLVHGDLKCENVLVSQVGSAVLADFGLATFIDKAEASTTTATGIRMRSSIAFAAPELLFGDIDAATDLGPRTRSKTPQTDVYAFGMLIVQVQCSCQP